MGLETVHAIDDRIAATVLTRRMLLTVWVLTILSGCVSIPDTFQTMGQRDLSGVVHTLCSCADYPCSDLPLKTPLTGAVLDATGFDLMNWNMLKGQRQGWQKDFLRISKDRDILIIQEAYLTDSLVEVLAHNHLNWDLAPAFEYMGSRAGVLTASSAAQQVLCMFRIKEPLINIPKSILITRHPLSHSEQALVVANVHSINFTLDMDRFQHHWRQLEALLSAFTGPIILAGDFNTWNDARTDIVKETARRLALKPVAFKQGHPTTIFAHVVDHIYYRGLTPVNTVAFEVTTSDHKPLVVTFKLDNFANVNSLDSGYDE